MNPIIEKWIENNYHKLLTIASKMTEGHQDHEDLVQECIIQLYESKPIKLKNYSDDEIRYYIVSILKLNWFSKTSRFHYRFRKNLPLTDIDTISELINIPDDEEEMLTKNEFFDIIELYYSELEWFHKSLLDLYLVLGSLKRVSQQTGIPLSSVGGYIKEIRIELKENINKHMLEKENKQKFCNCKKRPNEVPPPPPTPTPVKTN